MATVAALAGGVVATGCAPAREFAAGYEREARIEYRTEAGSVSYAIRRPAQPDFYSPNPLIPDFKGVVR